MVSAWDIPIFLIFLMIYPPGQPFSQIEMSQGLFHLSIPGTLCEAMALPMLQLDLAFPDTGQSNVMMEL